jgi:predicted N-acyltransferase
MRIWRKILSVRFANLQAIFLSRDGKIQTMSFDAPHIEIQAFQRIAEIDPIEWDRLSGERPFQSYRWHEYGERVMADCKPTYLLAYKNGVLSARASLWLIRNEPLPEMPSLMRKALTALFKRWPLLICRSPLVFTGGLIIAEHENQKEFVSALSNAALAVAKQQGASLLLFDYLSVADTQSLPRFFNAMSVPDPGTIMENKWRDYDEYIAVGDRKNRKNYNRTMRELEKLGVKITRHAKVERIDDALSLIRNVEQAHGSLPNPWARSMLERMEMVNGTFVTAALGEQIVGCGLLLEDNNAQTTTLLGHAKDVPFVYFMIVYESLKVAFEHKVWALRWGSGAYDIKQRLGFSLEDNGAFAFAATNPLLHKALGWLK